MGSVEAKDMSSPEEIRPFGNGQVGLSKVGGLTVSKARFEPGWRWSNDIKPIAETDTCMIHHTGYAIAGRLQVKTDEGEEREIAAGQAFDIQPGHDAWVVGDEAFETVDFSQDADRYATRPSLES